MFKALLIKEKFTDIKNILKEQLIEEGILIRKGDEYVNIDLFINVFNKQSRYYKYPKIYGIFVLI